jgi:hypothetical protein
MCCNACNALLRKRKDHHCLLPSPQRASRLPRHARRAQVPAAREWLTCLSGSLFAGLVDRLAWLETWRRASAHVPHAPNQPPQPPPNRRSPAGWPGAQLAARPAAAAEVAGAQGGQRWGAGPGWGGAWAELLQEALLAPFNHPLPLASPLPSGYTAYYHHLLQAGEPRGGGGAGCALR